MATRKLFWLIYSFLLISNKHLSLFFHSNIAYRSHAHWRRLNCVGSLKVLNNVTLWAPNLSFCKKIFGNVCESADVRNFARPHTRTRAKCVQRAWCGCRSFVLQKIFWKCVWKCECAKIRTSAHPHACEMCERVQVGVSGCKRVQAGARMCDLTFTHTMF